MSNSCEQSQEKARYAHFVTASNEALKMLKPLTVQGRRANNELDILFHRNDPVDLYGDHVVQTRRQPDIIGTSVHSARRVANAVRTDTWTQLALKRAPYKPDSRFQWYDVLCSVELQYIAEIKVEDVDAHRGDQAIKTVPPNFVKIGPIPRSAYVQYLRPLQQSVLSNELSPKVCEPAIRHVPN